jgi:hypothetical protein
VLNDECSNEIASVRTFTISRSAGGAAAHALNATGNSR